LTYEVNDSDCAFGILFSVYEVIVSVGMWSVGELLVFCLF